MSVFHPPVAGFEARLRGRTAGTGLFGGRGMAKTTPSERERELRALRDAYEKAARGPIQGPLGAHGLTLLSVLIQLLETGWDDKSRAAIAKDKGGG